MAEQPRAVALVRQEGEALVLCDEGIELLQSFGAAPLATVSVAGQYRTGKSFFLNQLAHGGRAAGDGAGPTASGFKVGSTTESCTRGIWLWSVPASAWSNPSSPAARLVLLDTEGLASMDNDETYDCKVFSLAILLSSFFVYNSVGVIDEAAIDRLFLVAELTRNICLEVQTQQQSQQRPEGGSPPSGEVADEAAAAELSEWFPPFLWLLRDFSLDMERHGEPITTQQYLEAALEDRPGSSSRVADRNRIRRMFKGLFRDRRCATLVRPVLEESDLRKLNTLPRSKLRPDFVEQLEGVIGEVLGGAGVKTLFSERITGGMLAGLARSYVDAINGGAVPSIRKSYEYVVEETLRKAFEAAAALHAEGLAAACGGDNGARLPSRAEFDAAEASLRAGALERFYALGGRTGIAGGSEAAIEWGERLAATMAERAATSLEALAAQSAAACAERAAELLRVAVRAPLDEAAFDADEDGAESMAATVDAGFLSAYDEAASGPAVAEALAASMRADLLPLYGARAQRVCSLHASALSSVEGSLREEIKTREGVERVVEARDAMVSQLNDSLSSLRDAHAALEAEHAARGARLASVEASLAQTAERLHGSELQSQRLAAELSASESARAADAERHEQAAAAAAARLATSEEHCATLRAKGEELGEALRDCERALAEKGTALLLESQRREGVESTLAERDAEIARRTEAQAALEAARAETQARLTATGEECGRLRDALHGAERAGDVLRAELTAEQTARAREAEVATSRATELEARLGESAEDCKCKALRSELDNARAEGRTISDELASTKAELAMEAERRTRAESATADAEAEVASLSGELAETRRALSDAESANEATEAQRASLAAALGDAKGTIEQRDLHIEQGASECAGLRHDVSSLQAELAASTAAAEAAAAEAASQLAQARSELSTLSASKEEAAASLREALASGAAATEAAVSERDEARRSCAGVEAALAQAKAAALHSEAELVACATLSDIVASVAEKSDVESKHSRLVELERQVKRIAEERMGLHEKLQDFFSRAATLPETYQNLIFCSDAGLVDDW